MSRVIAVSMIFVLCAGCGETQPDADHLNGVPQPPEATWQAQIAAVRDGRSDLIRVTESDVTSQQFDELYEGCESLKTLLIDDGSIENGDVIVLSHLTKLRWLKLPARLDDDGAKAVLACRELEILNLPNGVFTDEACAFFAELEELTLLRFGSSNVTDQGIAAVSRLPRLRSLHLLEVPITDAGLRHIASIGSLESFYLDGGRTTDAGLARLLSERPDLHFHRDQRHLPGDPNAHGDEIGR